MVLEDKIYGRVEIDDPLLIELIGSRPLQRLKGIAQFGIPDKYYHLVNYYRFEHCVGVMILLKKMGGSLEEQIAGLLHDVSHTAFSHLLDWVVGDGATENYQDNQHKKFLDKSEIPDILRKAGLDPDRISDYHHFGLLEREIPDLCADRIDYALKEFPFDIAKKCYRHLIVKENMIVFDNEETALLFARSFLDKQKTHWGGFEAVSRYTLFAEVLKIALRENIIEKGDFWQDDEFVINKLITSKNKVILDRLDILENKSLEFLPKSDVVKHKKFRYVNPLFVKYGKPHRLSEVNSKFKQELDKARKENEQGILIPFIKNNYTNWK